MLAEFSELSSDFQSMSNRPSSHFWWSVGLFVWRFTRRQFWKVPRHPRCVTHAQMINRHDLVNRFQYIIPYSLQCTRLRFEGATNPVRCGLKCPRFSGHLLIAAHDLPLDSCGMDEHWPQSIVVGSKLFVNHVRKAERIK